MTPTTMTTPTSELRFNWPDGMSRIDFRFTFDSLPDGRVLLPITMYIVGDDDGRDVLICSVVLHRVHLFTQGGDA